MSRDLDALVAEKVMGWTEVERISREMSQTDIGPVGWFGRPPLPSTPGQRIPEFSSDIAAAWQVVETMRANGLPEWRLTGGRESNKVYAWFDTGEGQEDVPEDERTVKGWGYDPSAPRAICLAALRAVGVPIPETP